MLKCIKYRDCKVKAIQKRNEQFVAVCHTGIALGASSHTLKGIVRNHLPQ